MLPLSTYLFSHRSIPLSNYAILSSDNSFCKITAVFQVFTTRFHVRKHLLIVHPHCPGDVVTRYCIYYVSYFLCFLNDSVNFLNYFGSTTLVARSKSLQKVPVLVHVLFKFILKFIFSVGLNKFFFVVFGTLSHSGEEIHFSVAHYA